MLNVLASLPVVLQLAAYVIQLAMVVILIRTYRRTRDVGFVWLGVAVVAWPVVSSLLGMGERSLFDRISRHESVGFWPFTSVERGEMSVGTLMVSLGLLRAVIGGALMLVAVVQLGRTRTGPTAQPSGAQ